MRLDSVRSLKREILVRREGRHVFRRTIVRKARLTERASALFDEALPLALGVGHHRGEHRLAIRIHHAHPEVEKIVEHLARHASGEVDVRFVGRVHPQAAPPGRRRHRPLRIGDSTGVVGMRMGSGTVACFVVPRGGKREASILSNNHVLANENDASPGDAVLQPGPADGGRDPEDRVGALARFVPLEKHGNRMDAALAVIDDRVAFDPRRLPGLGELAGVRTGPLRPKEIVHKIGRTSGKTDGRISALEIDGLSVSFPYPLLTVTFDDQIEIEPGDAGTPFSRGGDSGSLVVDRSLAAVGLLFAGNDTTATYVSGIDAILDRLRVRLAT